MACLGHAPRVGNVPSNAVSETRLSLENQNAVARAGKGASQRGAANASTNYHNIATSVHAHTETLTATSHMARLAEATITGMPKGAARSQVATGGRFAVLAALFARSVSQTDAAAAAVRVAAERRAEPDLTQELQVKRIIARSSRQTAAIGAATASAAALPGIGTITALTVGVAADMAACVRVQTAMVLEIAAARGVRLGEEELRRATLVAAGLATAGAALTNHLTALSYKATEHAALKLASHSVGRLAMRAVPFVGVVAASGTNLLNTQLIGRRADAYFRQRAAAEVGSAFGKRATTNSSGTLTAAPTSPITV